MRTIAFFCFGWLLLAACILTACEKEGPAGPQGPTGNADVLLYNFGPQTFTSSLNLQLPNLSRGRMDSSLVLVYYNPATETETAWYPIPGTGSGGSYETRYFIYQSSTSPSTYTLGLRTVKPDGMGPYALPVTFKKIKVVIAPASSVVAGGRRAQPDWKSYEEVRRYFGLAN